MARTPEPGPKRTPTQMRRVSMPASIPVSTPMIMPSAETKSLTILTPSPTPTPSPKTGRSRVDRTVSYLPSGFQVSRVISHSLSCNAQSASMKKALNPSQSSQEHFQNSHSRTYQGPRRSDPQTCRQSGNSWQGILTFDNPAPSGTEICDTSQRPNLPPLPVENKMQMGKKVGAGRNPDV